MGNRFYRNISAALSGTQEYMAAEKLYELHDDDRFDLVVVDTPPTRNALDFLEAPGRLTRFLDHRIYRALTAAHPGRAAGGQRGRAGVPPDAEPGGRRRRHRRRHRLLPGLRRHGGGLPPASQRGRRAPQVAGDGVRAGHRPSPRHRRGGPLLRPPAGRGRHARRWPSSSTGSIPASRTTRPGADRRRAAGRPARGPSCEANLAELDAVADGEAAVLAPLTETSWGPVPMATVPLLPDRRPRPGRAGRSSADHLFDRAER